MRRVVLLLVLAVTGCGSAVTPESVGAPNSSASTTPAVAEVPDLGWPGSRRGPAGTYSWDMAFTAWMHNPAEQGPGVDMTFSKVAGGEPPAGTPVTVAGFSGTYTKRATSDGGSFEVWKVKMEDKLVTIKVQAYSDTTPAQLAEAHAVIESLRRVPRQAGGFKLTFRSTGVWDSG